MSKTTETTETEEIVKTFLLTAVFHGPKTPNLKDFTIKTRVNSTLTPGGMEQILGLAPEIAANGPFQIMASSRLARALDTASVLAIELDMDFITCKSLGQHATDDSGDLLFYPGFEGEWFEKWQRDVVQSINECIIPNVGDGGKALVVSHRPMLAGLLGCALDVTDDKGLEDLIRSATYTSRGYVNFEVKVYESGNFIIDLM